MNENRISMRQLVVGGWYQDVSGKVSKGPFLVTYAESSYLIIASVDDDKDRDVISRKSLYGKLLLAYVPNYDTIERLCDKFNAATMNCRIAAVRVHPEFVEKYDRINLIPNTNHPCRVVVAAAIYDKSSRMFLPGVSRTYSDETHLEAVNWQVRYPNAWVVVCELTDTNTLTFKCPRCGRVHEHERGDGLRSSHCNAIKDDYIVIENRI